MTDLERAKDELLSAYRALERAQEQMHAIQAYLRQCETLKIAAQARVEALEQPAKEQVS